MRVRKVAVMVIVCIIMLGQMAYAQESENTVNETDEVVYINSAVRLCKQCEEMPWKYTIESSDSTICQVYELEAEQNNGTYYAWFTLEGKKEGKVDIILYNASGNEALKFSVVVKSLPDDAVRFQDPMLLGLLLSGRYDTNGDNYISKEEMENQKEFYLYSVNTSQDSESIKNLSGMEYAVNATSIDLRDNSLLEDISPLYGLKKIKRLILDGTNVSAEQKVGFYEDLSVNKGQKIYIPQMTSDINIQGSVSIEAEGGDGVIQIEMDNYGYYGIVGVECGSATLKIRCEEVEKNISVIITGEPATQEVGETMEDSVIFVSLDGDERKVVLKSNGELWEFEPKLEKLASQIEKVDYMGYTLKKDGTLWTGIGEDAKLLLENVKDFSVYNEFLDNKLHVWLNDGTLLCADINAKSNDMSLSFQTENRDVEQMTSWGYLKGDGTLYHFNGYSESKQGVEYIVESGYYVKDDGFYYDGTNSGGLMYGLEDNTRLSDKRIVEISTIGHYHNDKNGELAHYIMALSDKGEVWAFEKENYGEDIIYCGDHGVKFLSEEIDWMNESGEFYVLDQKIEPTKENPIIVDSWYDVSLVKYQESDNKYYLLKNGVDILNCVEQILTYDYDKETCWVLRTDGSIWKISDTVEKLGTVNVVPDYSIGDINKDNKVDLKDLMLCLNHVSKKSVLSEEAYMAADVDGNGLVELKDLMRILNYVSKKSVCL